jgi:SNF2 family DNA or RNA helicase
MGLGKTLQTIALLAGRDGQRPHFVGAHLGGRQLGA